MSRPPCLSLLVFFCSTFTIINIVIILQIMDFSQEEVAIFIAIVGVLSVIAQVSK